MLVVPDAKYVRAISISNTDDSLAYEARLKKAITDVQTGRGVLVLTDMLGGSPSNIGMTLHKPGEVEVMTGANLPMLIRALQLSSRETELAAVAREVREYGRRAITVASKLSPKISAGFSFSA